MGSASRRDPEYPVPPAAPPHRVRFPVNVHHWDQIAFLHWPYPPGVVQPLLADGLHVATFDDLAWVGVTPFSIRVRPFGLPVPPGLAFPETNLRTYVTGPGGRDGIQFLRMEVTARWFSVAMRRLGLPYVRRRMSVHAAPGTLAYRSRPVRSSEPGGHDIELDTREALDPPHGGPFERFLTARWRAFHTIGPLLLQTQVEHAPWSLRAATATRADVAPLFTGAGLPVPVGRPVVHVSPGVTVKVALPRRVPRR